MCQGTGPRQQRVVRIDSRAPRAKAKDPREALAPLTYVLAIGLLAAAYVVSDVFGRR
ncbi:MAG: hypothetical protein ACT4QF_17255 [Sporichthyaceae bacterium]